MVPTTTWLQVLETKERVSRWKRTRTERVSNTSTTFLIHSIPLSIQDWILSWWGSQAWATRLVFRFAICLRLTLDVNFYKYKFIVRVIYFLQDYVQPANLKSDYNRPHSSHTTSFNLIFIISQLSWWGVFLINTLEGISSTKREVHSFRQGRGILVDARNALGF